MPVTDRDRWLALGTLLMALLVAYALLIHPWWTVPMQAVQAEIESLQEREQRLRAQLAQAPQVQQRLAQVRAQQGQVSGFLAEPTVELASASLIRQLETVVSQASPGNRSCEIQNRAPMEAGARERYVRVTVQVRLRCGMPEMTSILHALESGSPRMFVGNLNVVANRNYFSPGTERAQSDGGLDVAFDLYGYLSPPAEDVVRGRP